MGTVHDRTTIKISIGRTEAQMEPVSTKARVLGGAMAVMVALAGGFWWMAQQYLAPMLAAAGAQ